MSDIIDAEAVETTALAVREVSGVLPVDTPEQARDAWRQYHEIQAAIMTPADYQTYNGVKRPNKSFVKKVQRHYQLSVSITRCERQDLGDGDYGYLVTARASAPNGYFVEATGGCSTTEKRFQNAEAKKRAFHDIIGTAETRATNRAVLNLIGGGIVTAEEVNKGERQTKQTPAQQAVMFCQRLGVSENDRKSYLQAEYGVESFNDLSEEDLRAVCKHFQDLKREERNAQ